MYNDLPEDEMSYRKAKVSDTPFQYSPYHPFSRPSHSPSQLIPNPNHSNTTNNTPSHSLPIPLFLLSGD